MTRVFNVSGDCKPALHYMVNIDARLEQIRAMVDRGEYFTINRARQFGKTTTLRALGHFLKDKYRVVNLDFQMISEAKFRTEHAFSAAFLALFFRKVKEESLSCPENVKSAVDELETEAGTLGDKMELVELFRYLSRFCGISERPVVLIIDEVDSATNNQVFLDFLAQLRGYYIDRDVTPAFQSVILAGVYDVKNIRRKIRPEDEHRENSPWNIAVDFNVDMSFLPADIAGMLEDYENDWHTGMDVREISEQIYDYTSGYPYLVSRICKLLDENVSGSAEFPEKKDAWTKAGITDAVRMLMQEKNTLFESLTGKINVYEELRDMLYLLLFQGHTIIYNPDDRVIDMAMMFGFVKADNGCVTVANRIFETRIYNYFLTIGSVQNGEIYKAALYGKSQFIQNGRLNMTLVLEKFVQHFEEIYGDRGQKFLEEDGRRYFLLYLRPIINGTGNYYIEARTRNMERTDVIVDYNGEQFVIEMKLWRGNAYHIRGEKQLSDYLEYYHLKKGYMLSFNFNKNKQTGLRQIRLGDKVIIEAVV